MANKEYFITKLSFRENEKLIKDVCVYELLEGLTLSESEDRQRIWMVNRTDDGDQFTVITPNPYQKNKWVRGNKFSYNNGYYYWGVSLPKNITRRKTFVSYYHHDNQDYREKFDILFHDLVQSKSVEDGGIDSDNSDEYIKQLIHQDYLSDTTVLVVLVGKKTKCRKHVDWEISGALDVRVGDNYAGVLGILLPDHPDFGSEHFAYSNLPDRLAANLKSGYAILRDWTDDRVKLQEYIEQAFANRVNKDNIVNKDIPQMKKNMCD